MSLDCRWCGFDSERTTSQVVDREDAICERCEASRVGDLVRQLERLSNEVYGNASAFEDALREAIGNTNFAVLTDRAAEARAILVKIRRK